MSDGLPTTTIVGLPDTAVREAKDRVSAALRNAGFGYPTGRVTVNLAPADVPKAGPMYDLPIALGILVARRSLAAGLDDAMVVGEVSLDGRLRHTRGVLPVAVAARRQGYRRLIVPVDNIREAALVPGLEVCGAPDLVSLVAHLNAGQPLPPATDAATAEPVEHLTADLSEIRGQSAARRALEIAAAGGHNLLMTGPPGSGKTALARCLPSVLPDLELDEALEVTAIYSVAGLLASGTALLRRRPFRTPHHTASPTALIGGGSIPRPGEVTLAHRGVSFLDELPEFERRSLEALRGPLEDRVVTISRIGGRATFPADLSLVAARNPCPCGYADDPARECTCPPGAIERYQRRLSGPLLDRFDLNVVVPRVDLTSILDESPAESSATVAGRVKAARLRQGARLGTLEPLPVGFDIRATPRLNASLSPPEMRRHVNLQAETRVFLKGAARRLGLSARGLQRTLRIALTIADLEAETQVTTAHVKEALQYRDRSSGAPGLALAVD